MTDTSNRVIIERKLKLVLGRQMKWLGCGVRGVTSWAFNSVPVRV